MKSQRRPCERRDPYSAAFAVGKDRQRRPHKNNCGRWLWVPAFAGTTEGFRLNFQSPVGWAHSCDLAAHHARSFTRTCPPQIKRAQGRPGARCTRGLVCNVHRRTRTRAYRFSGSIPAFPAQWLYGLLRALPGERLFCLRRRAGTNLRDLTPAPRRQDHTTSPYAIGHTRQSQLSRPPHPTARS